MTTIAYKAGVLAGDTRVVDDGCILPEVVRKVHRLKDGSLFGFAGDLEECELVMAALLAKKPMPDLKRDDTECIHVRPDGAIWWFGGRSWIRVRGAYVAMGSGKLFALTAMKRGASAVNAVRVARDMDCYTGGKIQTVRLK